ncbi:MAG TPA: hypothetical protein VEA63_06750 [Opitutus sp.]|nr:hypothetical protein [Opitutus sp.]
MRTAFQDASDARWFLGAAPDPIERLREALDFVKPGPLTTTTTSTLSERGVAEFLASLFGGVPVELGSALQSLDQIRAALVMDVSSDFISRRFGDEAVALVREHFSLDA